MKSDNGKSRRIKLIREMAITHADFVRLLPRLLDGFDYRIDGNTVSAYRNDQKVIFRLGAERRRRIAALTLPVTDVAIELTGFSEEQARVFINRFETTYRRGGG